MGIKVNRPTWLILGGLLIAVPMWAQDSTATGARGDQEEPKREPPKVNFKKLEFMAGCWRGRLDRETEVEEIWSEPASNLLLATTRYLSKKNRASSFEFSKIHLTDTAVVFSASTEGRAFDTYLLKNLYDEYVEFENLKKDFPQRIIYRLASDGVLIPRNEGDGRSSIEVRMKKVKCPGA